MEKGKECGDGKQGPNFDKMCQVSLKIVKSDLKQVVVRIITFSIYSESKVTGFVDRFDMGMGCEYNNYDSYSYMFG